MSKIRVKLVNESSGLLDSVEVRVSDPDDCADAVINTLIMEGWILTPGDRIEIEEA